MMLYFRDVTGKSILYGQMDTLQHLSDRYLRKQLNITSKLRDSKTDPKGSLLLYFFGEDFFRHLLWSNQIFFSPEFFHLEELLADGTHSRSSKFSEFADCFSRNKRSFLYEASMTKDEYLHILAYHVVNTSYGGSLESFIKHYQN